jgi:hypothetical protein
MSDVRIALIAYAAALPLVAVFALALCRASARGNTHLRRPGGDSGDENGAGT